MKICVLGAGTMGAGIAQAFAAKGYEVILRDIKDEFVDRGLAGINKNLSKLVAKEKITDENRPDAVIFDFNELKEIFPKAPHVAWDKVRRV